MSYCPNVKNSTRPFSRSSMRPPTAGDQSVFREIRDVVLPAEMQRAIARQAEAERNRRAAVIQAEGERQAAEKLAQASEILSAVEGGLTLRTLRSLSEISNSQKYHHSFPAADGN